MGSDGMEATDLAFGTANLIDHTPRRRCPVAGCECADSRIVSPRQARFHAYLARARGETADRVIAPDLGWRLPAEMNKEI